MYGINCVGNRTRMKKRQYEESNRRSSRKDEEKKKRRAEKKTKSKYARYCSSDEVNDIILYTSESEDNGKGKAASRNMSRIISTGRGETSKFNKPSVDLHLISSEDNDDFDGQSSKDAESVASVAADILAAQSPKESVKKKGSEMNPHSRVGSKNRKGKNKYVPNFGVTKCFKKNLHSIVGSENRKGKNRFAEYVQKPGEGSLSDDIVFVDNIEDRKKGKNLPRGVENLSSKMCRTSISKVGNKVRKSCPGAEISSKQPNSSYVDCFLLSSDDDDDDDDDDDGDSVAKSSEDEESVPSTSDSDSEDQSDTSEDSSSSSEHLEDKNFEISDHESSGRSESDASFDDEEDRLSSPEQNLSCSPIGETERKSAERQQSSKIVESGSSSSSNEDSCLKEEESIGKKNEATNQFPKALRRRFGTKEDDIFNILANSILQQDDMLDKMAFQQHVEQALKGDTRLPLKFSFDDEIPEPPEKSDLDKHVEDLFSEMYFGLKCEAMDSDSQAQSDEEDIEGVQSNTDKCDHIYVLNEEIGLICRHCGHVKTEIRHIFPQLITRAKRFVRGESLTKEKGHGMLDFESSSETNRNVSYETDGTVWDSLLGVRHTLYQHQREGFELLWRNIGGSIELSQLSATSSELGGCIISHAPGTGKTRLAILFIESYLKLFPGSRPLIIAPANILNTWEDEIKKWNVRFPFHNLNRDEPSAKENKTAHNKQNNNVLRIKKVYSWNKEDSILGVSYSLLEKLAGKKTPNRRGKKQKIKARNKEPEEVNNPWRDILLGKPGLVILDEGHTPRNQHSNIWNTLVSLQTRKIIILSGTPFQNNFQELMNSLRLIRPEVERALRKETMITDLMQNVKYSRHRNQGRQSHLSEDEVRGKAIDKFKAAIEPFVHVHKGSILQEALPGLREYAIILHPHELQKSLLKEAEKSSNTFEFEHKVALVSVHPQLLHLYSSRKERKPSASQDKLENLSLDPNEGVKMRFVLGLVDLSRELDEKVLIFSQYIEPLHLIRDQLEKKFCWREGQHMFLMEGGLLQNKRRSIIHSFNDPKSELKVLLASTRCCSEGISLVGASRVVQLDVVWNPSVAMQAISRAYRIGQTKMVYAYHLMISGSSEADKYRRQAEKERMSELVFTCTSMEVGEQSKKRIVSSDEKILEAMVGHPSMKNIFERVIDQPKQSSFFKGFGSPFES